jgi:hypothetical protein
MELSVTVQYKTGLAHYSIIQEAAGVFFACLEQYEGPLSEVPPNGIMLLKGVRRWTGSIEHQEILDELGRAIESGLNCDRPKNKLHENTSSSLSDK